MIRFFIFTVLIVSCAHRPTGPETLAVTPPAKIKTIKVNNLERARVVMNNNLAFIRSIFEQSHDPYYGAEQWSEKCRQENVIGKVRETSKGLFANSKLYLNDQLENGFCSNDPKAKPYHRVYYYCLGATELRHLIVPFTQANQQTDWQTLCP